MIDLQPFCSTEKARAYLLKPATRDGKTYATNGHILLRVDLRDDVPAVENFPDCERVFGACDLTQPMVDLPKINLPFDGPIECIECDGRGTEHECPDCTCACELCNGMGQVSSDREKSVTLDGIPFAMHYFRMIAALPGIKIPAKVAGTDPMPFQFDEGAGVLMPMRSALEPNIVARK